MSVNVVITQACAITCIQVPASVRYGRAQNVTTKRTGAEELQRALTKWELGRLHGQDRYAGSTMPAIVRDVAQGRWSREFREKAESMSETGLPLAPHSLRMRIFETSLALFMFVVFAPRPFEAAAQPSAPTMKAVVVHEYGDLELARYEDAARPEPKENEVLVRVIACGCFQLIRLLSRANMPNGIRDASAVDSRLRCRGVVEKQAQISAG